MGVPIERGIVPLVEVPDADENDVVKLTPLWPTVCEGGTSIAMSFIGVSMAVSSPDDGSKEDCGSFRQKETHSGSYLILLSTWFASIVQKSLI